MKNSYDVVVLGAGVSGLVGTSVLLAQGARSVLVVDEYDHLGGNHIDVTVGDYTFDVGSFLFQASSPLLTHFPALADRYVEVQSGVAKLTPQGAITDYPFSARREIWGAGPVEVARIVGSGLRGRLRRSEPRTAGDFARGHLGSRFVERSGLGHYMERMYGCPMDEIDVELARSRMQWIGRAASSRAILGRLTSRGASDITADKARLVRPRSGFAALYEPARAALEARGADFALGSRVRSVRRTSEGYDVERDGTTTRARRVVSTIPLPRAAEICGLPVPDLPTVTLLTLFYSFEGRRGFDKPILYNFTYDSRWKRMTVYSDFYGRVRGREYLAVEVVCDPGGTTTPDRADEDLRRHTASHGLLTGDLRLEGSHVLTHAYPIFTRGSGEVAASTRSALAALGIESFGRQGGFQYQPTAKVSTQEAEKALARPGE